MTTDSISTRQVQPDAGVTKGQTNIPSSISEPEPSSLIPENNPAAFQSKNNNHKNTMKYLHIITIALAFPQTTLALECMEKQKTYQVLKCEKQKLCVIKNGKKA